MLAHSRTVAHLSLRGFSSSPQRARCGIGWGLAGYCPGPALATILSGNAETWLFVPAMLVGGALQRWQNRRGEG